MWRLLLGTGFVFKGTRATAVNSRRKNSWCSGGSHFVFFNWNAADTSMFGVVKCVKVFGHLLQIAHLIAVLNT